MTTRTILFLLLVSAAAHAATIRGTVTSATATSQAPTRYVTRQTESGAQSGHASPPAQLTAVVIEPLDATIHAPATTITDTPQVMAQAGTRFVPNLLIVPVGGVVSFPNHDPIFHNVFSYSPTKTFDLGRYPKGETRTVTFPEPGIVRVFCEIHSSMYASIVVTPSPWHTLVPAGSEFSLTDLPSGNYRVIAVDAAGRHTATQVSVANSDTKSVALTIGK